MIYGLSLPPDSPKVVRQVIEKAFNLFRTDDAIVESHDTIDSLYIGFGLVALVLGVCSFIAKQKHRIAGLAGALGVVALAWEYVLIALHVMPRRASGIEKALIDESLCVLESGWF
jgi:hypothetical protein|tara:strand:+ start:36 stop:380 length:345 start_codon:yes stop_codon:yes gene_type:complete